MEGVPLEQRRIEIIHGIPEGKVNLQECLQSLKKHQEDCFMAYSINSNELDCYPNTTALE